jgi:D-alanine-D-alanine ligase
MPAPPFPEVFVLLPDPRLPDVTKVGGVFSAEDLESIARVRAALAELPGYRFEFCDHHAALLPRLESDPPRFVLNLCDTGLRNRAVHELHVPALLEVFGVPYSGSPPACLGLCVDKAAVRAIAMDCGVAVPQQVVLPPDAPPVVLGIGFPALVKPNRADGGLGITSASVVRDAAALERRIAELRAELPGQTLLVQEFLTGDEFGVGLIGNPGHLQALPILVVDWSALPPALPRILGYESKTLPDSPYWQDVRFRPAALSDAVERALVRDAGVLFARLGCRDYARFDFRAGSDGKIKLLEVNPNPAWCWDGKLNMMAGFARLSYPDLMAAILEAAQRRTSPA